MSNLLSPRPAALKVAVPDTTLSTAPEYGPTVRSFTVEIIGLQGQNRQREAGVHELEGRLYQQNVEVINLQQQVQKMAVQLHEAKSASRARYQRLQVDGMKHRHRTQALFKRAAALWRDQVVEFAVAGMDHILQDLCKRDKKDDGTGPPSGSSAV